MEKRGRVNLKNEFEGTVTKGFLKKDKLIYLLKQIFFGIMSWIYWSATYSLCKINTPWLIFSIISWILFCMFILNDLKKHKNEFGKNTAVVGLTVFFIVAIILSTYIGFFNVTFS